jgi:hypothetical protein
MRALTPFSHIEGTATEQSVARMVGHPRRAGFERVTEKFADLLMTL